MVLLCTFGIFYREYSSERERERERGSLNLMGINMALVYKMGGLDTEICEWK